MLTKVIESAIEKAVKNYAAQIAEKYSLDESALVQLWKESIKKGTKSGGGGARTSGYLEFSKLERAKVKAEHEGMSFVDISREIGRRWKTLGEDDKGKWNARAKAVLGHEMVQEPAKGGAKGGDEPAKPKVKAKAKAKGGDKIAEPAKGKGGKKVAEPEPEEAAKPKGKGGKKKVVEPEPEPEPKEKGGKGKADGKKLKRFEEPEPVPVPESEEEDWEEDGSGDEGEEWEE
jgi:hypothetical protein